MVKILNQVLKIMHNNRKMKDNYMYSTKSYPENYTLLYLLHVCTTKIWMSLVNVKIGVMA